MYHITILGNSKKMTRNRGLIQATLLKEQVSVTVTHFIRSPRYARRCLLSIQLCSTFP